MEQRYYCYDLNSYPDNFNCYVEPQDIQMENIFQNTTQTQYQSFILSDYDLIDICKNEDCVVLDQLNKDKYFSFLISAQQMIENSILHNQLTDESTKQYYTRPLRLNTDILNRSSQSPQINQNNVGISNILVQTHGIQQQIIHRLYPLSIINYNQSQQKQLSTINQAKFENGSIVPLPYKEDGQIQYQNIIIFTPNIQIIQQQMTNDEIINIIKNILLQGYTILTSVYTNKEYQFDFVQLDSNITQQQANMSLTIIGFGTHNDIDCFIALNDKYEQLYIKTSDIHVEGFLDEAYVILNDQYQQNTNIEYKCIERDATDFIDTDDICIQHEEEETISIEESEQEIENEEQTEQTEETEENNEENESSEEENKEQEEQQEESSEQQQENEESNEEETTQEESENETEETNEQQEENEQNEEQAEENNEDEQEEQKEESPEQQEENGESEESETEQQENENEESESEVQEESEQEQQEEAENDQEQENEETTEENQQENENEETFNNEEENEEIHNEEQTEEQQQEEEQYNEEEEQEQNQENDEQEEEQSGENEENNENQEENNEETQSEEEQQQEEQESNEEQNESETEEQQEEQNNTEEEQEQQQEEGETEEQIEQEEEIPLVCPENKILQNDTCVCNYEQNYVENNYNQCKLCPQDSKPSQTTNLCDCQQSKYQYDESKNSCVYIQSKKVDTHLVIIATTVSITAVVVIIVSIILILKCQKIKQARQAQNQMRELQSTVHFSTFGQQTISPQHAYDSMFGKI